MNRESAEAANGRAADWGSWIGRRDPLVDRILGQSGLTVQAELFPDSPDL